MKIIKNSILSISISILLFSCSNNNDEVAPQTNCLLKSIGNSWEIFYHDGTIFKIQAADQNDIFFTYNDNNQIIRRYSINADIDETYSYNSAGQMIEVITLGFGGYLSKKELSYNSDGKIVNSIESFKYTSSDEFVTEYKNEYEWDTNGNIVGGKAYRSADEGVTYELTGIGSIEYDDKQNYATASSVLLDGFRLEYFCQNNILKSTSKDSEGKILSEIRHVYEYNAQGFPTKKDIIYPDLTLIQHFNYECE